MSSMKEFWTKHPYLNEIRKNLLTIFVRPLMTILKVPANFFELLYQSVPHYADMIAKAIGKVCMFPFNVLIGFTESLGKEKVRNSVHMQVKRIVGAVSGFVKKKLSSKSVKRKMKIYLRAVDEAGVVGHSFLGDYYQERVFWFLAFLLQVVSFFTTSAYYFSFKESKSCSHVTCNGLYRT